MATELSLVETCTINAEKYVDFFHCAILLILTRVFLTK